MVYVGLELISLGVVVVAVVAVVVQTGPTGLCICRTGSLYCNPFGFVTEGLLSLKEGFDPVKILALKVCLGVMRCKFFICLGIRDLGFFQVQVWVMALLC